MNGTTNIRAGKGESYTDIFLTHVNKDVEMEISDVAIGTWFNCEGEWDFDMQQRMCTSPYGYFLDFQKLFNAAKLINTYNEKAVDFYDLERNYIWNEYCTQLKEK